MYLLIYLYTCFEMDQRMVVGSVGQFLFEISLDSFFFFGIDKSSTGFIYYRDSRILFKVFLKKIMSLANEIRGFLRNSIQEIYSNDDASSPSIDRSLNRCSNTLKHALFFICIYIYIYASVAIIISSMRLNRA